MAAHAPAAIRPFVLSSILMRLAFATSTPLAIAGGSGTFAGIRALTEGVRALGHEIELLTPDFPCFHYTTRRLIYNRRLPRRIDALRPDAVVGFDMDGYRYAQRAGRRPFVASIKGVIADELTNESGATRWLMSVQAVREKQSVLAADLVLSTSRYSAGKIVEHYGLDPSRIALVPELIDLASWRALFAKNPAPPPSRFTVLSVCRFYPRKRLQDLIAAAAQLPGIEVRIVGNGPEAARLHRLGPHVTWLGDATQDQLAQEYNRCHVFCLPSVQEGFGIVFLEAMAAGKPIVAARAAAVPEVVRDAVDGLIVDPRNAAALAAALARLRDDASLRARLASNAAARAVEFDRPRVCRQFLDQLQRVIPR
jgi:glycosyltransferase involved in cell wall biosynthesis